MKERIALLCRALRAGQPAVTALVTGCRGATPRSPGALLVLTAEAVAGTVGGGQAEQFPGPGDPAAAVHPWAEVGTDIQPDAPGSPLGDAAAPPGAGRFDHGKP